MGFLPSPFLQDGLLRSVDYTPAPCFPDYRVDDLVTVIGPGLHFSEPLASLSREMSPRRFSLCSFSSCVKGRKLVLYKV